MATIFNEDPKTLGYWLDTENGISRRFGFFQILKLLSQGPLSPGGVAYYEDDGNPINTWEMPYTVEGESEVRYAGLPYDVLDNFYMDRSGDKLVRTRFLKRFENTNNMYTLLPPIVERITRMYSKKWLDMWATMFYDYEPLWNYDMTETLTDEVTEFEHGHVDTLANGLTVTRTGSETTTSGTTITETKSLKGFNSDTFVDSDKTITAPSGNGDVTSYNNLADTHSGNDVHTHSGTDTQTKNYTLTRTGNIGVMSTTELIERQRKVVLIDYFNNVVFPDIDNALALKVY